MSKGKTITRNGDDENPAYKVERPGKNPVLKKVGDSVTCGHGNLILSEGAYWVNT